MTDESTDISRHLQVSLVIHYGDDLFNVHERFIGFEGDIDTTGEDVFNLVMECLKKFDLDVKYIVSQCFDRANSTQGSCKDVRNRATSIVPAALYVHCNGHALNLC